MPDTTPKPVVKSGADSVRGKQRTDLTAMTAEKQAKEHAAEQAEAAKRMAMMTAAKTEVDTTTAVDYTGEGLSPEEMEELGVEHVEARQANEPPPVWKEPDVVEHAGGGQLQKAFEIVRPRESCEFMLGAGNHYRFEAGRAAKVPFEVARHMEEKGLIW